VCAGLSLPASRLSLILDILKEHTPTKLSIYISRKTSETNLSEAILIGKY
jgi:hypothetical protein